MKTEIKKLIIVAYIKGVAHATVVPLIVMVLVNYLFSGNFGGVAALIYVAMVSYIYHKSTNKDLSKQAFQTTLAVLLTIVLVIALMVLTSAFN